MDFFFFFAKIESSILKFLSDHKELQRVKIILTKNQVAGLTLPDFKTYLKAQQSEKCGTGVHDGQQHRIKGPEVLYTSTPSYGPQRSERMCPPRACTKDAQSSFAEESRECHRQTGAAGYRHTSSHCTGRILLFHKLEVRCDPAWSKSRLTPSFQQHLLTWHLWVTFW